MGSGVDLGSTTAAPEAPLESSGGGKCKPDGQALPTSRKRRGESGPFLLLIVDHDNDRFTIEGPMTDADGWTREIIAARRARRNITCRVISGSLEGAADTCGKTQSGTRWPSGSIVAPSLADAPPPPSLRSLAALRLPRSQKKRREGKRRKGQPFMLIIVDHDTNRFTIEGPMIDAEGWTREIIAARKSGRQITCRVLCDTVEGALTICEQTRSGTHWPSGSIVAPSAGRPPAVATADPLPASDNQRDKSARLAQHGAPLIA
jgi:hypothetical protein